jgi:phosphoglycerate dehydrogenase-like enzyme
MNRVLIVPAPLFQLPGEHVDRLLAAGFEVKYPPAKQALLSESQIIEALGGVSAVIAGSEPYNDRVFTAAPQLRVVSRSGVGSDAIVMADATRHKVVVTITPGTNHDAVAETAMALLLTLARSVIHLDREVHAGRWPRDAVRPVRGSTLGIVGLGRIGQSVAQRATGFGVRIVACEKFPDREFVARYGIELVDLDTLLSQSDFVTLHVPMGPETKGLINRQTLARMKPGAILINTARGGLVVERDLLQALESGRIGGAGLDVFEIEPAIGNPLLSHPNVVASPHVAGVDTQSLSDMANLAAQNIVDLSHGKWPEHCVMNQAVRDVWKWNPATSAPH